MKDSIELVTFVGICLLLAFLFSGEPTVFSSLQHKMIEVLK